jgi:hypothetical protein
MLVTTTRQDRKIFFVLVFLILFVFSVWPRAAEGNDHKRNESHHNRYERGIESDNYEGQKIRQLKRGDYGNELTGRTAAWLLVAANLTVILSMLMKGVCRYLPLKPGTKTAITRLNQFQKKHLMRFHYVLNPSALCIAGLHFLLSFCGKSSLPEWGILIVLIMVLLGLMLKFKATPKWIRRFVHRLHTSPVAFSALILVLVLGHLMVG